MNLVYWTLFTTDLYLVSLLLLVWRMENMVCEINKFCKKPINYVEFYILATKNPTKPET